MEVNGKKRILKIFARLQNGEEINKEEMAQEYKVSTRSIQRDLSEIDGVVSDPYFAGSGKTSVKYDRNSRKYYMLQENGELLLPEEALAVCKILLGSKVLSKKQIKNIVDKLMKKDSGRAQVVGAGEIRNELEYYRENSEKVELPKIWELERSIEGQKYIDIVLQTDNNEYQKVKIAPKGIVFLEQEFYLAASKGEDDKYLEIYRICDIKEVINLEEKFSVVYAKRFQAGKFREEWEKKMKGSLEGSSLLVECA